MSQPSIFLDNASTTPMAPEIASLLAAEYQKSWANPASQHRAGRLAQAALQDAKERIVAACCLEVGDTRPAVPWQVVITSGGTEANNTAVRGLSPSPLAPILISSVEHPSVFSLATDCDAVRSRCRILPVDRSGQLNIDVLDTWLREAGTLTGRPLVSVMAGNNETGILLDLDRVSEVCRNHHALLHCDAIQCLGKMSLAPVAKLVDAFSISAHKIHGPVGVGALLFRSDLVLQPLLFGGQQQLAMRPGTESVPLGLALAAACELAEKQRVAGAAETLAENRTHFEAAIQYADVGAQCIGADCARLPHISSIAFPNLDRQALLMALDLAGVACSSGSACASGSSQPSHVLTAMQLPPEWVQGALRFSFSSMTSRDEIDEAIQRIVPIVGKMRRTHHPSSAIAR